MKAEITTRTLQPLAYHRDVVRYLRAAEPEVWAWASSVRAVQEHADAVRADLLRHTYRLSAQSHPQAQAAVELASRRLGLMIPVTLYQGGDGAMNASLYFLPDEAHVVFTGPVLERLSEPELLALLGHELSHYLLWTAEGGAFHTADRILQQTAADPTSASAHVETARRYSLYTEIFADRGGALAAESALPAISTLVKTHTGLAAVDPEAYLRQSQEVDAGQANATRAQTHPESFLRAQAVDAWWRQAEELDTWLTPRIEGPLTLAGLDLVGQGRLRALCRGFVTRVVQTKPFTGELAQTLARSYFPDWSSGETALDLSSLRGESVDDSVRDFLCAVLLDFALVDPDLRDEALPDAGRIAVAMGADKALLTALRKHLGLAKRPLDRLAKQWSRETSA